MKKFLLLLATIVFLAGCAQTAQYNKNLEVTEANTALRVSNPLQKAYIYIDKSVMKQDSFKSSTRLGEDELEIDLGLYLSEESKRFFRNYLRNLEVVNSSDILATNELIIIPEITNFSYGFYSPDGIDIDAKPFISYGLNLTIYKNSKEIFRKNIGSTQRHFGEMTFFGTGVTSYAQIGPLLQKAIASDYNRNATDIISAINSHN